MSSVLSLTISDLVEAYHDIWFVGDNFLKEMQGALFALCNKAVKDRKDIPYIFKYFNVSAHYSNKGLRNGINRMLDPLVDAMNEYKRLPKYIVMVPDKDLLTQINWSSGSSIIIGASLYHVIRQQDIYIERCRSEIAKRKPGALLEECYPKIVWICMLRRPLNLSATGAFQLRGKFNSILEDRLLDGNAANHYIMSIEVMAQDFDLSGNLTSAGKASFWLEAIRAMEKFGNDDITLRPRKYKFSQKVLMPIKSAKPVEQRKLLTPPPKRVGDHNSSPRRSYDSGHYRDHRAEQSCKRSVRSRSHSSSRSKSSGGHYKKHKE